ncbi:MAG: site-specific integrase [Thaumarchaeota archaeon]|nr:site-specific integrase [Nitrososphaerota archaeon]
MEISIDDINKRSEPYQLFLDSIKSPETARKYKNALHSFLKIVPVKLYSDTLNKTPKDQESSTLASFFVKLSEKDPNLVSNVIATFIKNERKLVESGEMSSNTLPNHIKPIRALLDANRIPLHWKSLNRLLPRRESRSDDRAYTRAEIQKMIEVAPDITDKLIILLFSSGGFRLESWNYFTWKDYVPFKNKDGSYKGGAMLVYRGDPESYWTFITPEACKTLEIYREKWNSEIGAYPRPDDPLIKAVKYPVIRILNARGIKKRVDKIVTKIGLRPPLPPGKKRHEVQLDHGFRKYFNTMMRRAKVNYLDKEDMMGHKVGLERHYERYLEEDFERFPEYEKAIPFLTISDEERLRFENEQKQQEIEEIEQKNLELQDLSTRIDELEHGPKARSAGYFRDMFDMRDDSAGRILLAIFYIWFEMRATEDEKRTIWKKIQDAEKNGKTFSVSEFGKSDGLSWKNLSSSTKSHDNS